MSIDAPNMAGFPADTDNFDRLTHFLTYAREGLESVTRWLPFLQNLPVRRENVLQHSYETTLLAVIVVEALKSSSDQIEVDFYSLVACAAIHDLGEAITGDVLFLEQTPEQTASEASAYRQVVGLLPRELWRGLIDLHNVQDWKMSRGPRAKPLTSAGPQLGNRANNTRLIFEFIERFGYVLFAMEQVSKDPRNRPLLRHVLDNQLERVDSIIKLVPALSLLFPKESRSKLMRLAGIDGQKV